MITVYATGQTRIENAQHYLDGVYFHCELAMINGYDIPYIEERGSYDNMEKGIYDVKVKLFNEKTSEFICTMDAKLYYWRVNLFGTGVYKNRGLIVLPNDEEGNESAMELYNEEAQYI